MKTAPISRMTGNILLLLLFFYSDLSSAQNSTRHHILIDIAHGQKFWNDPARMAGMDKDFVERIKYMTGEITKSAASVGADVSYATGKILPDLLNKYDLLFVHIPSSKYTAEEVNAIQEYLAKGGSLFFVMDADYWSTLEQVNANDIIGTYGIKFGKNSPDTLSGGYTKAGPITKKPLKITYHGARTVSGGTPFCFSNQSEKNPFGTFIEIPNGGKIVAMGDGMVSLYMTSWKDVNDYQCSAFMHDVFAWLLDRD